MKKRIFAFLICVVLALSLAALPASAGGGETEYRIEKDDTLWKISNWYKLLLEKVIKANPQIKNPNLVYPEQEVKIPDTTNTTNISDLEKAVVAETNKYRKRNGLSELTLNEELSKVARIKSQDMADNKYFSHTSPVYGSPFQMMSKYGINYRSAGENLAKGPTTAAAVVEGWMNSSGHRANILNPSFTQIGVGFISSGNYWTQMFIG